MYAFKKDDTSKSILVVLRDTSSSPIGQGKTGLAFNTASLQAYYTRGETGTPTSITLVTQTSGGAYSSGGFVAKDGTNAPGVYRLDVPNAVLATGVDRAYLHIKCPGVFDECIKIDLLSDSPYDPGATLQQIADSVGDNLTADTKTLRQLLRAASAALLGVNTGTAAAPVLKSVDGAKTRVTSNADRTSITVDFTP